MAPRADLRVGRVVRRTVEALRRSWLVLLVLGLPTVVLSNALFGFLRVTGRIEDPGADVLAAFVGAPGENLVVSLAGILFSGGAVAAVLGALGGSPLSVKGAFVESGRHFGAQFVITLLSTIAIAVGLVLLIVPGLLLWARWFVAPAVRVAERRSGSESMGRSADLTEGLRVRLLGIIGVFILTCVLVLVLVFVVCGAVDAALGNYVATDVFGTPLFALFAGALTAAVQGAAYDELRRSAEGGEPKALAEVFA